MRKHIKTAMIKIIIRKYVFLKKKGGGQVHTMEEMGETDDSETEKEKHFS